MERTKILWLQDCLTRITAPLRACMHLFIYLFIRPVSRLLFGKKHPLSSMDTLPVSKRQRARKIKHLDTLPGDIGNPAKIPASVHQIDRSLISPNALRVVETLQAKGHHAFIVGGAVRDLLIGKEPKDFDVATDATPDEVQACFRRALLIGRRFQIVHVTFGREILEVSTFRSSSHNLPQDGVPALPKKREMGRFFSGGESASVGSKRSRRSRLEANTHAVNASGLVLRDNIWGSQHEDVARRDFTVNAMYYDPHTQTIVDYYNGLTDVRARVLRMIGDPVTRYREDPMRMLRAVRFAAKLGFDIAPETRTPIHALADLIRSVPPARLFDEVLKLLLSGHALNCLQRLRAEGLHHGVLPLLDEVLGQPDNERFFTLALSRTDERILAGKSISPSFLFAALLWHDVRARWEAELKQGLNPIPALYMAMNNALLIQTERLAIQKRYVGDMRIIWDMQPRLEKRGRNAMKLLEHPRFRAAYDFLLLRCEAQERDTALGQWWTDFIDATPTEREALLKHALQHPIPSPQLDKPKKAKSKEVEGIERVEGAEGADKKPRRRRTKKPAPEHQDTPK